MPDYWIVNLKNGTIEVTDPNGLKGGITLFGDAVSSFATDLRPFINANATDKYKIAVLAMGIGEMLEELEIARKAAFTARTGANAIATQAKASLTADDSGSSSPLNRVACR